ncbi:MAG: hypothetical protein ABI624_19505, partial [Casimicrobiaceae bacterium]
GASAGICNNNPPLIHTFVPGLWGADERSMGVAELLHHEFMLRRNLDFQRFLCARDVADHVGRPFMDLIKCAL